MNITLQMHELRRMLRDAAEVAVKLERVDKKERSPSKTGVLAST